MTDVTQILNAIQDGDPSASDQLLPLVYEELRLLARQRLANEKPGQTLQATALVHEAYVRLVGKNNDANWDSRGHFFAAAAEAMRRIVVDAAKRKRTLKRGGDRKRLDLEEIEVAIPSPDSDVLALSEALERLEQTDPDVSMLVKLRYFAGFTIKESAEILGISVGTANNNWTFAKAWLLEAVAAGK